MAKVNIKEVEQVFKPFTLEITFESREEVERFASVFNHASLDEIIGEELSESIHYELGKTGICRDAYYAGLNKLLKD